MTTPKLTNQDRKDLDKFTKYFVYKCIQIIVQSRLGHKVKTKSKAFSTGSDWFNLALKDLPEVFSETKKVFAGSTLLVGQHVCVELSLQTAEGETMVLETWSISMTDTSDPSTRVSYTVYNRMSILLKALICVSRATPAYRLSRKQGAETYVICYRVYMGEPQVYHLGEGFAAQKVGAVPTPLGTILCNVMFRTKLLFSPHVSRDLSVDLKDDHFMPDISPRKGNSPRPCRTIYHEHSRGSSSDETGGTSSESECCATMFSCSPADHSPGHFHYAYLSQQGTPPPHIRHKRPSSGEIHELHNVQCNIHRNLSFTSCQKRAAFAPSQEEVGKQEDDIPFMALLPQEQDRDVDISPLQEPGGSDRQVEPMDSHSTASSNKSSDKSSSDKSSSDKSTSDHEASGPEDFVMVELKTPFAGNDANTDLGRFYRECQVAPQLCMFNAGADLKEAINTITDQLATFEANATDYDDFIKSLETDED